MKAYTKIYKLLEKHMSIEMALSLSNTIINWHEQELQNYNNFLQKNGYTDSDVDLEEPTAISRYLSEQNK